MTEERLKELRKRNSQHSSKIVTPDQCAELFAYIDELQSIASQAERMREALEECCELSYTFCCSASCEEDARTLRAVVGVALSDAPAQEPEWEYGVVWEWGSRTGRDIYPTIEKAQAFIDRRSDIATLGPIERRRVAGPWQRRTPEGEWL